MWNNVHVGDLADLFSLLLEKALQGKAPTGKDGYFFAENGESNLLAVAEELARVLHQKGISQFTTSEEFPKEVADERKLLLLFTGRSDRGSEKHPGLNSRGKAEKGKSLGWKPHRPSLIESVAEEVDYWLKQSPESYTIHRLK